MTPEDMIKVEGKVERIEVDIKDIKLLLKSIADSLGALTALEVKHQETKEAIARAFAEIKEISARVTTIEQKVLINTHVSNGFMSTSKLIFERIAWVCTAVAVAIFTWWLNNDI